MLSIDIIITCYNRAHIIRRAIDSALAVQALSISTGKVIVVDDASTDESATTISAAYPAELAAGRMELVKLERNLGVTGAKNAGLSASTADWAVILDSDDTLLPRNWPATCQSLEESPNAPLVLFRCVDEHGTFVGTAFDQPQMLDLTRFLTHTSYGEVIVAVNRTLVARDLYDTDLRGGEGVGCARVIKRYGPAILSPIVLRQYDQSGTDRLSSPGIFRRRARSLAQTHARMLRLFWFDMPLAVRAKTAAKVAIYSAISFLQKR